MDPYKKRRAFGQHFLKDTVIANEIASTAVQSAVEAGCTSLLEIGPGRGAITRPLFQCLSEQSLILNFILCEKDRELVSYWKEQLQTAQGTTPVTIEEGDFLELDESIWLKSTPLAVVSNLPYSAGTAILVRLAQHPHLIRVMVLMFQAEVAKRLRAQPSTKEWGSLSIWIQNRWEVKRLLEVPPKAFKPPPKVNSEVVILTPRAKPQVDVAEDPKSQALWESLLKACFQQRRKMLRSSLHGPFKAAFEASGIDGTRRAEALNWDQWRTLYEILREQNSDV